MSGRCPPLDQLLGFALEEERMSVLELERHLVACESCKEDVATIRQSVAGLRARGVAGGTTTETCLGEFDRIELVEGAVDGERRRYLLDHVSSCEPCRTEVAGLSRALAEPSIADEIAQLETAPTPAIVGIRSRRATGLVGLAAAAAVAFFLIARPSGTDETASTVQHRGREFTEMGSPVVVAPVGPATRPINLTWRGVPTADRYRVELFDATGTVLWEVQTNDTIAALPDSVALADGAPYFWKVEARTDFDRWAASELVEFTISN